MALQLKKANRGQVKLRLAIAGASGSGKTMSSLLLAYGLIKAENPTLKDAEIWDKICLIDTENGSGSLYTGSQVDTLTIGQYNVIDLSAPFTPKRYVEAIHIAEEAGMSLIIIDSLTHAWTGEGGALDQQGKAAQRIGNSYVAWREVTPEHNKLVDAMLQSKCHVIANMRAKQDYVQEKNDKGKTIVRSVGMGIQMRDGIEYEFTTCFMLDYSHIANASKDRTKMFDGQYFLITPETGRQFHEWLTSGAAEVAEAPAQVITPAPATEEEKAEANEERKEKYLAAIGERVAEQMAILQPGQTTAERKKEIAGVISGVCGTANYTKIEDVNVLAKIYKALGE